MIVTMEGGWTPDTSYMSIPVGWRIRRAEPRVRPCHTRAVATVETERHTMQLPGPSRWANMDFARTQGQVKDMSGLMRQ